MQGDGRILLWCLFSVGGVLVGAEGKMDKVTFKVILEKKLLEATKDQSLGERFKF